MEILFMALLYLSFKLEQNVLRNKKYKTKHTRFEVGKIEEDLLERDWT